jgi:hypothetical protein
MRYSTPKDLPSNMVSWVARVSQLVARSATHNAILPSHQYEKLCRPAVHANVPMEPSKQSAPGSGRPQN